MFVELNEADGSGRSYECGNQPGKRREVPDQRQIHHCTASDLPNTAPDGQGQRIDAKVGTPCLRIGHRCCYSLCVWRDQNSSQCKEENAYIQLVDVVHPGDRTKAKGHRNNAQDKHRQRQQEAYQLGVTGVPFYVFDGRYGVSGAQPSKELVQVLHHVIEDLETVR